ncbi:hypothetical protein D9M72_546510 [compost metagenome]
MRVPGVRQRSQEPGDDVPVLLLLGCCRAGPGLLRTGLDVDPDSLRSPSHLTERRESRATLGVPDVAQPVRPGACGPGAVVAIGVVLRGGGERSHGVGLSPDASVEHPLELPAQAGVLGECESVGQPHDQELRVFRRHRKTARTLRP